MFGNWFKKPKPITKQQAKAEGAAMVAFLKPPWGLYAQSLPANDTVPLSARMKMFVSQMRQAIGAKFPEYRDAPDKLLLNVLFLAVLEANTHSVDAVETAMVDIAATDIEVELKTTAIKITAALREKWIQYLGLLPFREETPLATKVELFLPMANEYVTKYYPVMATAPSGMIWEMVWVAVIESKTHKVADVDAARAALAARFAG